MGFQFNLVTKRLLTLLASQSTTNTNTIASAQQGGQETSGPED